MNSGLLNCPDEFRRSRFAKWRFQNLKLSLPKFGNEIGFILPAWQAASCISRSVVDHYSRTALASSSHNLIRSLHWPTRMSVSATKSCWTSTDRAQNCRRADVKNLRLEDSIMDSLEVSLRDLQDTATYSSSRFCTITPGS